jgi:hypothetical protein
MSMKRKTEKDLLSSKDRRDPKHEFKKGHRTKKHFLNSVRDKEAMDEIRTEVLQDSR